MVNMYIKNRTKRLAILFLFLTTSLTGCDIGTRTQSTDHFVFEINTREKFATVIGLTELGREQEVLVIPSLVDKYPVKHIGKKQRFFQPIDTNALRLTDMQEKIYLPYSLVGQMWLTTETTVEAILSLAKLDSFEEVFIINSFPEINLYYLNESTKLNTFFMYNFDSAENDGYHWVDYINGSNPYIIPSDPVREGYSFDGWYYEEECIDLWDNQVPASETENLTLYAKWI